MQWDPEHLAELQAAEPPPAGLDPPFLKDDGSPVTPADAAVVQAAEAKAHGGHISKGGFAAAVQKAAEANRQAGFTSDPTPREMLAAVQQFDPVMEELPTVEEAQAIQVAEREQLGRNPHGGLASKAMSAAHKADLAMKRAIEAGGVTEETAAFLQSAESKLFGQVLPGGVASEAASYAKANTEAGLFPPYHPRHRHAQRRAQDAGLGGEGGASGGAASGSTAGQ
ncbi:hypothetical protein ABPG75_000539 [Micractinium tetrahymenae]